MDLQVIQQRPTAKKLARNGRNTSRQQGKIAQLLVRLDRVGEIAEATGVLPTGR
jgi:hypothetical protein